MDVPEQICGSLPESFEVPPKNIAVQSRDFSRRFFTRWLIGQLQEELADVDEATYKGLLRLALMDAATGSVDASIRFELDRPYAAGLKPYVDRYEGIKKKIDAQMDEGTEVGRADLYALGGKVAANIFWRKQFAGQEPGFTQDTLKGLTGVPGEFPVQDIYGRDFSGNFGNLYRPADLTAQGTPVLIGRTDAAEAAPEGLVPAAGASAEELRAWFERIGVKYLALVPLAQFLDNDGTISATLHEAEPFKGFIERNDKDAAFPGLVEKRVIFAFTDAMTVANFGDSNYCVPAFVKSSGWTCKAPYKDFDFRETSFNKKVPLECKPLA